MDPAKVLLHILRASRLSSNCTVKFCQAASGTLNFNHKYSTQNKPAQEMVVKEKIQLKKPSVVKWKRPPFLKNFFFGKFDTELLAFPEILDKEQLTELESVVQIINNLYAAKVNTKQIDEDGKIADDVLQDLKDMGFFGRMIPPEYGGLGLTYTACTRLNEALGLNWSVYSTLAAHEFFASQVILLFGSEEQKRKYLPDLASGKVIAAVCCSEFESGCDLNSLSSTAKQLPDGSFILNGIKCWVTNAELANLYIVFAKSKNDMNPTEGEVISVFIVEKSIDDITITPQENLCLRGANFATVQFKEVVVPKSNLVGIVGSGFQIYLKALEQLRIALNTFTFGTLKVLLDSATERIIHTERFERSLGDIQLVRQRLSKISSMIYGMESVSYFTAALLDSTENPDISLESAATKLFNSEGTLFCLKELMEALGSSSLMKEQLLEIFYRDAQGLAMFDSPNDMAKLYIGLTGCKVVGAKKVEDIIKMRNRFFFPMDAVKLYFRRMRISTNKYKYDQDLAGHIHPSLVEWGNVLEQNLQKFEVAVENVLSSHGKKVVDTQIEPTKLSDIAVDLYAMSAVLSRSSRSYCLGLRNSHHELRLAFAFCYDAHKRIFFNLNDLFLGMAKNNEANHLLLGEQVIDCRGYFPEHPLKHNF